MRATLCTVVALAASQATAVPQHAPYPGSTAVLEVGNGETAPIVHFGERRVLTVQRNGRWLAIVGIPLERMPGPAEIRVRGGAAATVPFTVGTHDYRTQHLTVAPSFVAPAPEVLERIAAERRLIDAALRHWRDIAMPTVQLQPPLPGRRSDSFGSRRFFNNEPRSPHRGMDIAGTAGTPILAPLAGSVTLRGAFYFTGNTVILDHGRGLITLYAHLEKIDAATGTTVDTGSRIGTVGSTGRVTGPHLHFATYLNGTPVDPALLFVGSRPQDP